MSTHLRRSGKTNIKRLRARNICTSDGDKYCGDCKEWKPLCEFFTVDYPLCGKCDNRRNMLDSSKSGAAARGLEHTIDLCDIPTPDVCKYLGVPLDYKLRGSSGSRSYGPSIDRVDNSKGYIPDNIQVISELANRMKSNATIEQLIAFAEGILRTHKS